MAGFIFSIAKEQNIEGVKHCIKKGAYASKVPNDKLSVKDKENTGNKSKQVMAAVLADYCSMKEGDNVYFLSDRQIYGVGKLVNIGPDCKYKNFLDANVFEKKEIDKVNEIPLYFLFIITKFIVVFLLFSLICDIFFCF